MRRVLLLTLLALAACTPSQDTAGTGTPTSDPADLAKLGTQIDKSDQRIAAAVTVARENADKPEVVRAETGVALAYLPKPDAGTKSGQILLHLAAELRLGLKAMNFGLGVLKHF